MIATDMLHPLQGTDPDQIAFFGELSLDGSIQPISGALPIVIQR